MSEWSTGDWHEDRVALYEDDGDTLVCWLQKQGGVETKDIRLIEAAPELLAALEDAEQALAYLTRCVHTTFNDRLETVRGAINKAKGGSR